VFALLNMARELQAHRDTIRRLDARVRDTKSHQAARLGIAPLARTRIC